MLVGHVYRLKVTNIPFHEGQEVFPSIEVINRLYPPQGMEAKFPIPIELTREELEMAMRGQFVIRVIYLEDPRTALPRARRPVATTLFRSWPQSRSVGGRRRPGPADGHLAHRFACPRS